MTATRQCEDSGVVGLCPGCAVEVAYEAWLAVFGEESCIGCPNCRRAFPVDDVFGSGESVAEPFEEPSSAPPPDHRHQPLGR